MELDPKLNQKSKTAKPHQANSDSFQCMTSIDSCPAPSVTLFFRTKSLVMHSVWFFGGVLWVSGWASLQFRLLTWSYLWLESIPQSSGLCIFFPCPSATCRELQSARGIVGKMPIGSKVGWEAAVPLTCFIQKKVSVKLTDGFMAFWLLFVFLIKKKKKYAGNCRKSIMFFLSSEDEACIYQSTYIIYTTAEISPWNWPLALPLHIWLYLQFLKWEVGWSHLKYS